MGKYYIITNESDLSSEYWEFKKNMEENRHHVNKFVELQEIEAHEYSASKSKFYIVPTDKDLEKFDKKLAKPLENGLRAFKINSLVAKDWGKYIKDNEIKFKYKPFVGSYFGGFGRSKYRLFHIDNVLYCTYECDYDFNAPVGFTEIKASEFYRVVEDHNEIIKNIKN